MQSMCAVCKPVIQSPEQCYFVSVAPGNTPVVVVGDAVVAAAGPPAVQPGGARRLGEARRPARLQAGHPVVLPRHQHRPLQGQKAESESRLLGCQTFSSFGTVLYAIYCWQSTSAALEHMAHKAGLRTLSKAAMAETGVLTILHALPGGRGSCPSCCTRR